MGGHLGAHGQRQLLVMQDLEVEVQAHSYPRRGEQCKFVEFERGDSASYGARAGLICVRRCVGAGEFVQSVIKHGRKICRQ